MKNTNVCTRILSLALTLAMLLSMAACSVKPAQQEAAQSQTQVQLQTGSQGQQEYTREDKELIAELTGGVEDPADLTDEELDQLVAELTQELEEEVSSGIVNLGNTAENVPTVDTSDKDEVYDENGAMTKPFDQIYPELIEKEQVAFSGESILVKLKDDTLTDGLKAAGIGALEAIVPMEGAAWYEALLTEGAEPEEALAAVRELSEVLLAEYNYEIQTAALDHYKDFGEKHKEQFDKNEHHDDQWYMHHCGIPDAMESMVTDGGDPSVIVAVIDSGVDYDHEDLADNMWVNTAEIPDNGIDDDANGYVDDYYGVDIVAGRGNGDDTNGHGTHVAGIIAAQNNNLGTVGIAYNVKIMSVKAAMHNGTLNQADIARAVLYAYSMGAEVINMSFGGTACSIAVQDALATAYTRCVLVASAGNNGAKNEGYLAIPNYPAALTYVLGVMSVDETGRESAFTNWDVLSFNGVEYELYAPGESIMSTLPNDQYGLLSGTSMAAPVVSAMAAILRSEFTDRDKYPTKFIYGQLASTSGNSAECLDPDAHGDHNLPQIADLYSALTKLPKPEVNLQDYALFDDPAFSEKNNGDGVIDAGETIALGLTLRNRWGMSENTQVTIDTVSGTSGMEDPYITIQNPTVNYGSVGTYSTQDCGRIYTDEIITGWEDPFYITISEDCPNDYRFTLNVTITCENALDEADETVYTTSGKVNENVRSGYILPAVIEEDMVLTPENLYIIPKASIIQEGVTVRVEPGTHIQFWSDDPDDPYADDYIAYLVVNGNFLVEGTRENPVYIYPSQLMDRYIVDIGSANNGYISMTWADVTNYTPGTASNGIDFVDHCTFRKNYGGYLYYRYVADGSVGSSITSIFPRFDEAVNSVFYKLSQGNAQGSFDRCIFVDCGLQLLNDYKNCVFLGNSFVDQTDPDYYTNSYKYIYGSEGDVYHDPRAYDVVYRPETGTTYITADKRNGITYQYLKELLGVDEIPYVIIETEEELQWMYDNITWRFQRWDAGIYYDETAGSYVWSDGSAIADFLDPLGYLDTTVPPYKLYLGDVYLSDHYELGIYRYSYPSSSADIVFYELPGQILPTEITFREYVLSMDMESTIQLAPINTPVQLPVNSFLYESSDETVITVSDTGLVTPVAAGTADVWVYSLDKAVKNHVTIEVKDYVALEGISFPTESVTVYAGQTYDAGCILTPADTTRRNVVYTSSDEKVATVDAGGIITGIGSGTATITATCEGITASMTVTVYQMAKSLTLSKTAMALSMDSEWAELPQVITDQGAEPILFWGSTDPEVADIEDGVLVLKKLGTTTIYVRDQRSGLMASCLVIIQTEAQPAVKDMQFSNYSHWVLLENGDLYLWDSDHYPTATLIASNVSHFDVYGTNCLLAKEDGTLEQWSCWSNTPQRYHTWTDFVGRQIIDVGYNNPNWENYFVVTADGCTYAKGQANSSGSMGLGTTYEVTDWELVMLENVVDVEVADYSTTYFLTKSGDLYYAGGHDNAASPTLMVQGVAELLNGSGSYAYLRMTNGQLAAYQTSGDIYIDPYNHNYWSDMEQVYFRNNGSTGTFGIRDGQIYIGSFDNIPQATVSGITNAVDLWVAEGGYDAYTLYITTEDHILYALGANPTGYNHFAGVTNQSPVTAPVVIPILPLAEENVTLTQSNVFSGVLSADRLQLQFNKELTAATPKLYAGDTQVVANTKIVELSTVEITRSSGFSENTEYRLVFPAGSLTAVGGAVNEEEIVIPFLYVDAGETQPDETTDTTEPTEAPVVYESILDETVERIWTLERVQEKLTELHETYQLNYQFYNNAVLNPISTDFEVKHWLRPQAGEVRVGTYSETPLGGNWWGTVNETAIGLQLIDGADYPNYAHLIYAPFLEEAPEDTFPFVTSVKLFNKDGEEVTTVGNEEIKFQVKFNRDMDTSVPLLVRFGSAYPYGDYEISGEYVDERTWEGTYTLNALIENGYQYFTISNGWSATDDLQLQLDQYRFFFEIDTTAAQALIMQAGATDTGIQLKWTQDDFDTLMGYNVYRSEDLNGYYQRLNTTVIPADTMEWFDDTVEPGKIYYYNFTVVQTDMTESEPSGKISLMSKDTMAPNIYHTPIYTATMGQNLVISADVTDNLNIVYANLYYRVAGSDTWKTIRMNNLNDKYSAILPAGELSLEGMQYYIEAFDGVSYTYRGSEAEPYTITMREALDKNALGDVDGDGTVTNRDALILLQAISHKYNMTAEEFERADLNGDDVLSAVEALRILHYVTGKVGSLAM